MISDELEQRMRTIKHKHFANDTIYSYLDDGDLQ